MQSATDMHAKRHLKGMHIGGALHATACLWVAHAQQLAVTPAQPMTLQYPEIKPTVVDPADAGEAHADIVARAVGHSGHDGRAAALLTEVAHEERRARADAVQPDPGAGVEILDSADGSAHVVGGAEEVEAR